MAIKIPSKHIYSMDNPKIRDNFIDNVKVGVTLVKPNNDYETPVHNETFSKNLNLETFSNENTMYADALALNAGGNTTRNIRAASILKYTYTYITIPEIHIPIVQYNKYVSKVFDKTDDDGNENIKYSVEGIQTVYDLIGTYQPNTNKFSFVSETEIDKNSFSSFTSKDYIQDTRDNLLGNLIVTNLYELKSSNSATYNNGKFILNSYIRANSNNNWSPSILTIDNKKELEVGSTSEVFAEIIGDEYVIKPFEVLYSVETSMLSSLLESASDFSANSANSLCSGIKLQYLSTGVTITIYGNTIGISLEDGTITYGSGTKPFSLDGNELLQDSATTNGKLTTQHLADNILAQYKNGKETATLLCDIGEYYEEDGTKKIGIEIQDRMSFHEHDLVIPYVFGADGKDRPMSKYSNGEPKVFEVVSVKRFFDGAVWQELSLLEFAKTTWN